MAKGDGSRIAMTLIGNDFSFIPYDRPGNHDEGRNVLHMDGHVRWYPEQAFKMELRDQYERYKKNVTPPPELEARVRAFFEDRDP